jgi:hypothetical protein
LYFGCFLKFLIALFDGTAYEWMWSGAHGSTHDSGARGPGFDSTYTQTQDGIYLKALIPLLSDNRLNKNCLGSFQVLWNKNCTTEKEDIIMKKFDQNKVN